MLKSTVNKKTKNCKGYLLAKNLVLLIEIYPK